MKTIWQRNSYGLFKANFNWNIKFAVLKKAYLFFNLFPWEWP